MSQKKTLLEKLGSGCSLSYQKTTYIEDREERNRAVEVLKILEEIGKVIGDGEERILNICGGAVPEDFFVRSLSEAFKQIGIDHTKIEECLQEEGSTVTTKTVWTSAMEKRRDDDESLFAEITDPDGEES